MESSQEGARIYSFETREQRMARVILEDEQKEQAVIEKARLEAAQQGRAMHLDLAIYTEEFRAVDNKATSEQWDVRDSLDIYLENALDEDPIDVFAVTYSEHQGKELYHTVRYHGIFDRVIIQNAVKNWDEIRNSDVHVSPRLLDYRWLEVSIVPYANDKIGNRHRVFNDEQIFIPISKIAAVTFNDGTV